MIGDLSVSFRVIETDLMVEQFRFPRTHNRRIRRKWSRRAENHRPRRDILFDKAERIIYAHPVVAAKIRALHSDLPDVKRTNERNDTARSKRLASD